MKIFSKRPANDTSSDDRRDRLAVRIVTRMLVWQTKITSKLNKKFSKFSVQRLKLFLVAFCMVSGGFSLYFIMSGILKNEKSISVFNIEQARMPIQIDSNTQHIQPVIVDEATWQKIKSFKFYLDSLKTNHVKEFDSLMLLRPGLVDSITMIEEMYYSQK